MKVSGIPAMIALMAAPATAPPRGVDIVCDYSEVVEQDVAFRADYSASPIGTAFIADYASDTYSLASDAEARGQFWLETAPGEYGSFAYGIEPKMLYGGFVCDYALAVTPTGPVGFDGVAFRFDYAVSRFVAQTYPPQIVFTCDYSQAGRSVYADYVSGAYQSETGVPDWGRFQMEPEFVLDYVDLEDPDGNDVYGPSDAVIGRGFVENEVSILSGTPLRSPAAFAKDQMVIDFYTDDRLGYFVLGSAVLGGASA